MKSRPFITVVVVLVVLAFMTGYALWETFFAPKDTGKATTIKVESEESIPADVYLPEGITWHAPGIEVGTLYYTVTRASVLTNVYNAGIGTIRESATMGIYDTEGNLTLYHYPECIDEFGELVGGGTLLVLDVTVTSQDAVNFITNKATGVQSRRYADNPFLFRADEIAYIVDITENAENGYTFHDAVFFTQMGSFEEHEMAYELLPGESISFRIGYLIGNRPDGSALNPADLVLTTNWGKSEKEFYDLKLS